KRHGRNRLAPAGSGSVRQGRGRTALQIRARQPLQADRALRRPPHPGRVAQGAASGSLDQGYRRSAQEPYQPPGRQDRTYPERRVRRRSSMNNHARRPLELRLSDWMQVLLRTGKTMIDMDTSLRCAGVAFFSFLSIFPSIAIVVLLVGLLAERSFLIDQLERLSFFMPDIAFSVIVDQLDKLMNQPPAGLGIGLAISIAVALWSGSRGVNALIYTASSAYYEKVDRNFIVAVILSFVVTVLGA